MGNLDRDFQRLMREVRAALVAQGVKFHYRPYGRHPGRRYSLRAPNTFAWVDIRPKLNCLAICTRREWADLAGVNDYECKPNWLFGSAGAYWRVPEGNDDELQEMARYLAVICKVRHMAQG